MPLNLSTSDALSHHLRSIFLSDVQMTFILASFLQFLLLTFQKINYRKVVLSSQFCAQIPLFWLVYCRAYLYLKILEFTRLLFLSPDTYYLQGTATGKSQLHLPRNTNNSFRNICMHASCMARHFLAGLLGTVQLELGSTVSPTG